MTPRGWWPALALLAAISAVAGVLLGAAASPASPHERRPPYSVERDLDYRRGPPAQRASDLLDLYRPRGLRAGARRPVVVWIHGGGWRRGDKRTGARRKAELFTGAGYLFASVNYRLSPLEFDARAPDPGRVRFPDHPADVGEALGWLRRHVAGRSGDPRRLLLIGHSAGAHLAALVATEPRFARAHGIGRRNVIGFVSLDAPAFDLAAAADPAGERSREQREMIWNAFATPEENAFDDAWAAGSPLRAAGPGDPPGLIVTQAALPQRVDEATRMAVALGRDPAASVLALELDHREINHALGERSDRSGETAAVMSFVRRLAAGARAPR